MAPVVEAVLLLFDDSVHTFNDVTEALESLGIPPPAALLITTQVNAAGVNVISKGSIAQMQQAAGTLTAFNVSVVRTSDVDTAVAAAGRRKANTKLGHLELDAPRQKVKRVVNDDTLVQCPAWSLAGACSRRPFVMYTRCETSCVTLGPNYLMAAMPREQQPLVTIAAQSSSILGIALLVAGLLTSAKFLFEPKKGARRRAAGVRIATFLLTLHYLVDGLSGLAAAADGGFVIDDGEGVLIQQPGLEEQLAGAAAGSANATNATAVPEVGLLWGAICAACLELTYGLGSMPWVARAPFDALQASAALISMCGRFGSRTVQWSGYALLASAVFGALHVVLSVLIMQIMGGGVHLSELMAKKLALMPATALWVLQTSAASTARGEVRGGGLPLPSTSPPKHARASFVEQEDERRGWVSVGLLLGRLVIAALLAAVGGTELWRLLFAQLAHPGAAGTAGDALNAAGAGGVGAAADERLLTRLRTDIDPSLYRHRIEHEHGEIVMRLPQLLLTLPLAVGATTAQVACALAMISTGEALLVWQWWQAETRSNPVRLAHSIEHFTVNLAISGGLLLLPLRGSGLFTLDQLVKKLD